MVLVSDWEASSSYLLDEGLLLEVVCALYLKRTSGHLRLTLIIQDMAWRPVPLISVQCLGLVVIP